MNLKIKILIARVKNYLQRNKEISYRDFSIGNVVTIKGKVKGGAYWPAGIDYFNKKGVIVGFPGWDEKLKEWNCAAVAIKGQKNDDYYPQFYLWQLDLIRKGAGNIYERF